MKPRVSNVIGAWIVVCVLGRGIQAEIRYSLTDIGTFSGYCSVGASINNLGQVAGWSAYPDESTHAFFYNGMNLQDLGTLGGYDSRAFGLNDKGQVVGTSYPASATTPHAFLWEGDGLVDLNWEPLYVSTAYSINNSSAIAGGGWGESSWGFPVIWKENTAFLYEGLNGGISEINDSGQFVGAYTPDGTIGCHAYFVDSNVLWDLGTLGGTSSQSTAINGFGLVVGYTEVVPGDDTQHPFLWKKGGQMLDLGVPSGCTTACPKDINNLGQIVGYGGVEISDSICGFLYENGTINNLNDLISPDSGWQITSAFSINDIGQITGEGIFMGKKHAYIMNPVPEPSSMIISVFLLWISRKT